MNCAMCIAQKWGVTNWGCNMDCEKLQQGPSVDKYGERYNDFIKHSDIHEGYSI